MLLLGGLCVIILWILILMYMKCYAVVDSISMCAISYYSLIANFPHTSCPCMVHASAKEWDL